jgi:hypothetical protein
MVPLQGYNAFIYPAIAQHARVKVLDYGAMNYFHIIFGIALDNIFAPEDYITNT